MYQYIVALIAMQRHGSGAAATNLVGFEEAVEVAFPQCLYWSRLECDQFVCLLVPALSQFFDLGRRVRRSATSSPEISEGVGGTLS
jgi:hypothetical protein